MAAGDHLVHHCPTWQWATGDEDRAKSYLPKTKQFLLTRNVPCTRRCKQVPMYFIIRYAIITSFYCSLPITLLHVLNYWFTDVIFQNLFD